PWIPAKGAAEAGNDGFGVSKGMLLAFCNTLLRQESFRAMLGMTVSSLSVDKSGAQRVRNLGAKKSSTLFQTPRTYGKNAA
ncbi:MAG: hypothetical protein ACLGI6_01220, partial [Gammaproteobacteria bacterium]